MKKRQLVLITSITAIAFAVLFGALATIRVSADQTGTTTVNVQVSGNSDYEFDNPNINQTVNVPNLNVTLDYTNLSKLTLYMKVGNTLVPLSTWNFASAQQAGGTVSWPVSLNIGPNNLVARGWDTSGGQVTPDRNLLLYYDPNYTEPNLVLVTPGGDIVTSSPEQDMKVSYNNLTKVEIYVDGKLVYESSLGPGNQAYGTIPYTITGLTPGVHTVVVKGFDLNGNPITRTLTFKVTYAEPPYAGASPDTGMVRIGGMSLAADDYLASGVILALFASFLTVFLIRLKIHNKKTEPVIV
ncbi:MAG: hypothetical protein LBG75_01625 [Candidatus Nomurabacteria bacterium]|jgi:hypothetical protein|nr:hypothetical protein [Candidatus Nomurabacteria bacterium]